MEGKRKFTVLVTALALMVFLGNLFSKKAEAANVNTVPNGYEAIRTIEDLMGINNDPSGKYILMNDIDMTEATKEGGSHDTGNGWNPLREFSGVLDGNGCYIKGMHIYGNISGKIGLFRTINGATVRNLGVIDCDISVKAGTNFVGPIAGYAGSKPTKIENCFSTGKVDVIVENKYDFGYVGGIVGSIDYDTLIQNCYSNAQLRATQGDEYAISSWYSHNCYFAGTSTQECVGFFGETFLEPSTCYYLVGSMKTSTSSVDANPLTQVQMRSKKSFVGWDFDKVWFIDPYSYYQYPQLRTAPQVRISGIEIISLPIKSTYAQGENISLDGAVAKIIYEDGNTATVAVNDDFEVEYDKLRIGQQNVKLSYLNASTTFPVTFTGYEVTDIELSASATNVAFGNKIKFTARTKPEQALDTKVTWSLKDVNGNEVPQTDASITQNGVFSGNKLGKYVVTVTAKNGVSKSYTVTVTRPMVYLIAEPEELSMNCGDFKTIKLKQSPLDSTEDIVWSSSNSRIATVENGVVTAHMPGIVEIRAKTESCDFARCTITVMQDIMQCDVSGLTKQVYTGKEITLKNLKVYSDKGLLRKGVDYTVSYKNNKAIGTATVIIKGCGLYSGTISETFEIVRGDIQKAKISCTSATLKVNATKKLKINGVAGYKIKWSSKSKKIATVDKNGIVIAKTSGKTYIVAKVGSRTFKCKIIVLK